MSLRKNIIALALFNAASLLKEQEEAAAAMSPVPAPEPPSPEAGADSPSEEGAPAVDEKGNVISLDTLIDRINIIRSGLSFEDPEVYGKLTTLFKGFSAEDKVKLYKQLTDISAIVQNIPSEKQSSKKEEAEGMPAEMPAPPAPAGAPPPAPPAV